MSIGTESTSLRTSPPDLTVTKGRESSPEKRGGGLFGADGLTFGDLLDIINPLQHIPIISSIYRSLTGDEISPGARMAGGGLFGGFIGYGVALLNSALKDTSGRDLGEHVMAMFTGPKDDPVAPSGTALAALDPALTHEPAMAAAARSGFGDGGIIQVAAGPGAAFTPADGAARSIPVYRALVRGAPSLRQVTLSQTTALPAATRPESPESPESPERKTAPGAPGARAGLAEGQQKAVKGRLATAETAPRDHRGATPGTQTLARLERREWPSISSNRGVSRNSVAFRNTILSAYHAAGHTRSPAAAPRRTGSRLDLGI